MTRRKTHEEFVGDALRKLGVDYEVVGQYKTSKDPIEMFHVTCGNKYTTTAGSVLAGKRCPHCFGTPRKTTEQFIDELRHIRGNEYVVVGEYKDIKTKIAIRHNVDNCGKTFETLPGVILAKHDCPYCTRRHRATQEEFEDEIRQLVGNEYSVISKYKSRHQKVHFVHNDCNRAFWTRPNNFVNNGSRCPHCRLSKGAVRVQKFLHENRVTFKTEYKIHGCSYKRVLPFDFAIFNSDGQLFSLIEYDGEQHSRDVYGDFEIIKIRDSIKNAYCLKHQIKLIRINYTDFDLIEEILSRELSELIEKEVSC